MTRRKKIDNAKVPKQQNTEVITSPGPLLEDLRSLILSTREGVAQSVNSALVLLNWEVGSRIYAETLKSQRAGYGEEIVATLSRQLTSEFGRGYSNKALWRMVQFSQVFEDREIVSTLSKKLSWSHFVEIIPLDEPLIREFYTELCQAKKWSVRTLRAKVQGTVAFFGTRGGAYPGPGM